VEVALLLGNAVEANLLTLGITVLVDVLLSTLEDNGTLLLVGLIMDNVSIHVLSTDKLVTSDFQRQSDPKDG
jgi:hypothetical protein